MTWGLPCHGEEGQEFRPLKFVLDCFPVELFPGLRRLVVEVRLPVPYQALRNHERIGEVQGGDCGDGEGRGVSWRRWSLSGLGCAFVVEVKGGRKRFV